MVVKQFAVAIAYFLPAQLSFFLRTNPDDIAAFWLAAGVATGILVGLGPRARLPVAVGTVVASVLANLSGKWSLSTSLALALCNAGQVLLVAGLIQRYFGSAFSLDSLLRVLGLIAAAIVGTAAAAIGAVFVEGSAAPALKIATLEFREIGIWGASGCPLMSF